ncbi:MAG TPA: hypothetical protein VGJ00_03935 [Rhabdochlamydiaceae bacterium]
MNEQDKHGQVRVIPRKSHLHEIPKMLKEQQSILDTVPEKAFHQEDLSPPH